MIQGQSAITPAKEHAFFGLFDMNLRFTKNSTFAYHHFDLNAGCGHNHAVDCPGSPIVFLEAIRHVGIERFYAHFVDRDKTIIRELLDRIDDERCTLYNGDNREFIYAIPDLIRLVNENPKKALGDVLCDPNGTEIHWQELSWLGQQCSRLDLFLNYPSRVWKRHRGAGFKPGVFLDEQLAPLNKKVWHIQEPLPDDPLDWMLLVGRNYPLPDWPNARLYKLSSRKGQEIFNRFAFSQRERNYALF